MNTSARWGKVAPGLAAMVVCGVWLVGCGSDEQAVAPGQGREMMMVNGMVVQDDSGLAGAMVRLTPLDSSPGSYGADLPTGAGGKWGWGGPQGRYRAEVLVDGKAVATKELDLTKPKNPDVVLEVEAD